MHELENKKIITRKILIDDSILPRSVMNVEQKVEFEKINGMWLSEHSVWDEYKIPQYNGVRSSIDIIPAKQVNEDTMDETINVVYYPDTNDNQETLKEDKSENKDDDLTDKSSNYSEESQEKQKEFENSEKSEQSEISENPTKESKKLSLVPDSDFNKFVKSLSICETGIDWSTKKSSLIPFKKRNAWLRNIYEVEQNTKDLREVGMITLNQNGFRPQYYDE